MSSSSKGFTIPKDMERRFFRQCGLQMANIDIFVCICICICIYTFWNRLHMHTLLTNSAVWERNSFKYLKENLFKKGISQIFIQIADCEWIHSKYEWIISQERIFIQIINSFIFWRKFYSCNNSTIHSKL